MAVWPLVFNTLSFTSNLLCFLSCCVTDSSDTRRRQTQTGVGLLCCGCLRFRTQRRRTCKTDRKKGITHRRFEIQNTSESRCRFPAWQDSEPANRRQETDASVGSACVLRQNEENWRAAAEGKVSGLLQMHYSRSEVTWNTSLLIETFGKSWNKLDFGQLPCCCSIMGLAPQLSF